MISADRATPDDDKKRFGNRVRTKQDDTVKGTLNLKAYSAVRFEVEIIDEERRNCVQCHDEPIFATMRVLNRLESNLVRLQRIDRENKVLSPSNPQKVSDNRNKSQDSIK